MATSKVAVTEGSGANVASYSVSEDAVTKQLGRVTLNNSAGTEIGNSTTPVQVSLANTAANATAVKVDGSATTQPVSAASLPLPSGASTSAKQPALGTAGTASADVITVQGIASMTALKTDGSGVTQPVSGTVTANAGTNLNTSALALESGGNLATVAGAVISQEATTSGVKGVTAFGAVTTNAPTYVTAKSDALSLDTSGLLRVSLKDTPANTNKLLVTPDSVALPANQSVNMSQVAGTTTDTNSGVKSAGTLRVVLATDQPQLTNKLLVTPDANSAVNVAQMNGVTVTMGNGVAGTGVQRVAIASDNTAFTVNPASATAPVSTMNSASAASGVTSAVAGVFDDTSPTSITENSFGYLRMSANRNLYNTIRDAAGNERGANVNASNQLSVSVDNSNVSTNIAQMNGVAVTMNNGAAGTGVQRVTLASDSTGNIATIGTSVTPGTGATNLGKAEDAAHTSADTGVMVLGVRETTLTDLSAGNTDGDYEPFQVNKSGAVWVTGAPSGTSGWSVATGSIGATKTDIGTANTAGNVGGWYIYNPNSSVAYVQFFNAQASAVTLGSTAPIYSLGIPATSAANIAPGMVGISHATAICIAVTTTRAGSTGPSSTVDYNIWYKQ